MYRFTALHRGATVVALALLCGTTGARGQGPQAAIAEPGKDVDIMLMWHGGTAGVPFDAPLPPDDMNMAFMTAPLGIAGATVTGAPYSAEAVTAVVQTFADGNRIVHESRTALYRDAAGRTRREQGLAIVGPLVGGGDPGVQVQISDPVAGVNYMLDIEQRHVIKMPLPKVRITSVPGAATETLNRTFAVAVPPPGGAAESGIFFSKRTAVNMGTPVTEQLGKQWIEGVEAQGTRSTLTIPAGVIGNDQPILVISERWYSPELKALVLTRQSDPRYGETTYRLSNLVRSEPSADLFQVPPDFTLIEPPQNVGRMMLQMDGKDH